MIAVTNPLFRLACLVLLVGSLAGCERSAQSRISRYDKAFSAATPDISAQWDTAMNALKSKDYAIALGTLIKMATLTNLAPEQAQAVREVSTAVSDEICEAANKGDPKAKQAIDDLRKIRGR